MRAFRNVGGAWRGAKEFLRPRPRTGLRHPELIQRARTAQTIIERDIFPRFPGHDFKNYVDFSQSHDVPYAGVEIHDEKRGHVANVHFFERAIPQVECTEDSRELGEAIARAFHESARYRLGWKRHLFVQKKLLPVTETNLM